jgi:trafficking protein particle complex subunit 1
MIFNFYIYNRRGKLLYYKEWNRPLNTLADDIEEERKLMFGMIFSMKDLCGRLSPATNSEGLHTIRTDAFALHHFESASGIMFIMNTDPAVEDLYLTLKHIYSQIYIECVSRNPLYQHTPDSPVNCPLFVKKLDEFVAAQAFSR